MPSTASPLLQVELQATGENNNNWGVKANASYQRLEEAIAGTTSITLNANVTLTDTQYNANESRAMVLSITGTGGFSVTIPNRSKVYLVRNASSGAATITTGSGTTLSIAAGDTEWAYCNGANAVYRVKIPTAALQGVALTANNLSDLASAPTARTNLGLGSAATLAVATASNIQDNTADKVIDTDAWWSAQDTVALVDAANIAVNLSFGLNFSVTLGGNRTLGNPTNTKNGQRGLIYIVQDATGSRTLIFGGNWKFAGGTSPTLTTTPNAVDVLEYQVRSPTFIVAKLLNDVK